MKQTLKEFRESQGLSRAAMARSLGYDRAEYLRQVEEELLTPSDDFQLKFMNAFKGYVFQQHYLDENRQVIKNDRGEAMIRYYIVPDAEFVANQDQEQPMFDEMPDWTEEEWKDYQRLKEKEEKDKL